MFQRTTFEWFGESTNLDDKHHDNHQQRTATTNHHHHHQSPTTTNHNQPPPPPQPPAIIATQIGGERTRHARRRPNGERAVNGIVRMKVGARGRAHDE